MRILIVNDDSVSASQLVPLIRCCQKYGQVTAVVPKFEQSGKSHGIELLKPFEAKLQELEPGLQAWVVDSTPADCVRFALFGLHLTFDLCISGINRGFNMGSDILYSGTVSAALEAAMQGIPSLAVSTSREYYENAVSHMDDVWQQVFSRKLFDHNKIYNINIPKDPKGVLFTHQGGPFYSDDYKPVGENLYQAAGVCVYQNRGDLTLDTDAVMSGYLSISPLTTDRTHLDVYRKLKESEACQ